MATVNIEVEKGDWQDLITLGSLSLTDSQSYTMAILSAGENEACISSSEPAAGFVGHPVKSNENFGFTFKTGDKIWVKLGAMAESTAIVVLS